MMTNTNYLDRREQELYDKLNNRLPALEKEVLNQKANIFRALSDDIKNDVYNLFPFVLDSYDCFIEAVTNLAIGITVTFYLNDGNKYFRAFQLEVGTRKSFDGNKGMRILGYDGSIECDNNSDMDRAIIIGKIASYIKDKTDEIHSTFLQTYSKHSKDISRVLDRKSKLEFGIRKKLKNQLIDVKHSKIKEALTHNQTVFFSKPLEFNITKHDRILANNIKLTQQTKKMFDIVFSNENTVQPVKTLHKRISINKFDNLIKDELTYNDDIEIQIK